MNKIKIVFLIALGLSNFPLIAQSNSAISGVVKNQENDEPLPYASITLLNYAIGTISNEDGEFDFYIPKSKQNDTISISFIGFNTYLIPIRDIKSPLEIKLNPATNLLDEVIVSRLSPLEYVKKALENLDQNYPRDPYQTIAYYREKFIENDAIIKREEAVFKTYYSKPSDTVENQHQLLLYRPAENPQKIKFMRDWIDKKQAKETKKAIKRGEDVDEDFDLERDMNMGGPETIINLADLRNDTKGNFLNPKHFKKYEYTFGDETSLNGETLVTINFKAKRKIDYIKDQGKILISKESYAIALIEGSGVLSIPVAVKPILFIIGLSISNPTFNSTVSYQKFKGYWYPKLFRWDAKVNLTKRHAFSSNEHAKINIGQVLLINKLDSIATSIPENKRFNSDKEMENQVHNDLNIEWNELNIVKD
jgi:hypothetical protein